MRTSQAMTTRKLSSQHVERHSVAIKMAAGILRTDMRTKMMPRMRRRRMRMTRMRWSRTAIKENKVAGM